MWMIETNPFIGDEKAVNKAALVLQEAHKAGNLSVIVGNGPSQSAAWLNDKKGTGWTSVVKAAAMSSGLNKDIVEKNNNNLALAQAVLIKNGDPDRARAKLVSAIKSGFVADLEKLTAVEMMLVDLSPQDIVTTNYDFQIERAFHKRRKSNWKVLVRHDEGRASNLKTVVHKMHGSFKPSRDMEKYYAAPTNYFERDDVNSIVITESDYDHCYNEIHALDIEESSLMKAFCRPCLIIGKGLDPQDLSFVYALRKTRHKRLGKTFALFNDVPSVAEQLTLHNLAITPLVINMPYSREDAHYYIGMVSALARLFPFLNDHFNIEKENLGNIFCDLVKGPDVLAIGLASHNIVGRIKYNGANAVPNEGRKNFRFDKVEEHAGGPVLTTLAALAALNSEKCYQLSAASAIGNDSDVYSKIILNDFNRRGIDADAVSKNQSASWVSTVLVHTCKDENGKDYPGQRIFLDRGYEKRVTLDRPQISQLHAQLAHPRLRLLYLDKFLGQQHPPPGPASPVEKRKLGQIFSRPSLQVLKKASENKFLDIVYESGAGGSYEQHVEKGLADYINIFTCGFPFFANVVLYGLNTGMTRGLKQFAPSKRWYEADFSAEMTAIRYVIDQLQLSSVEKAGPVCFDVGDKLMGRVGLWARRHAQRRWFIVTLHHLGSIGFDLNAGTAWYCKAGDTDKRVVENTSGAGDTYRGALLYGMLCSNTIGERIRSKNWELPVALGYASDVATERCYHFSIEDALTSITQKFSGRDRYEKRIKAFVRKTGSMSPRTAEPA